MTSTIQVTKYLARRFNFEVKEGANMSTILNIAANAAKKSEKEHTITVAEVEAEDEYEDKDERRLARRACG